MCIVRLNIQLLYGEDEFLVVVQSEVERTECNLLKRLRPSARIKSASQLSDAIKDIS